MKKIFLIISTLLLFSLLSAQTDEILVQEETIGISWYDLQTTRSMQSRMYVFEDGRIGAVWNIGQNFPNFSDLGIGYNFFDGDDWGVAPFQGLENNWAKNPTYGPLGEFGEIIVAEGTNGLILFTREFKGSGDWQVSSFPNPPECNYLYSPQIIATGENLEIIHLLAMKEDDDVNLVYQENNKRILYSRSIDGGQSWEVLHQEFDELGPDHYLGFSELALSWAEPVDNTIAFFAGDYLTDLVLMKSMDGGVSWEKTIVWKHPYPLFQLHMYQSDSFYCNTGQISLALDSEKKVHASFAISRIFSDTSAPINYIVPGVDGIVYWNEDMMVFSDHINALSPNNDPGTELIEDVNLVGWTQDLNGNGYPDYLDCLTDCVLTDELGMGLSNMPSISIGENNSVHIIFSSVTEGYDNGQYHYRHVWKRSSWDDGLWWGGFEDLSNDLIHIFDDCFYPFLAKRINHDIHTLYNVDNYPGIALLEHHDFTENKQNYLVCEDYNGSNWLYVNFYTNVDTITEGENVGFINMSNSNISNINYNWDFEGGEPATSSEENPVVNYPDPGVYSVSLTGSNSAGTNTKTKEDYIVVLPMSSTSNQNDSNMHQVHPNPTIGRINIHLTDLNSTIRIFNPLGRIIFNEKYLNRDEKIVVDLSEYDNGIYFLETKSGNSVIVEKVLLQK